MDDTGYSKVFVFLSSSLLDVANLCASLAMFEQLGSYQIPYL